MLKRWIATGALTLSVLAAPAALKAQSATDKLYADAKKEGELTWYVAHYDTAMSERIGKAFTEKYPGVKVNVLKTTAQVAFQRVTQDLKAGDVQADVLSSTDVGHYVILKQQGALEKYTPDSASKMIEAFRGIDPDGYYHVTWAGLTTLTYNTQKVKPEDAPKNWTDLLDPKWKDQISSGSANFSGTVGTWTVLMKKLYGWDFFEKLAKNNPLIGRSIDDTVTMLNAGERSVAVGDAASTLRSAQKGNPLALSYPTDGALVLVGPSAVLKGAKHPNAGKLFIEFLMSEELSRMVAAEYEQALRPEVQPPAGMKSLKDIKTVRLAPEEIAEGIPVVRKQWKETFGN